MPDFRSVTAEGGRRQAAGGRRQAAGGRRQAFNVLKTVTMLNVKIKKYKTNNL